jgi:hypothetical protein
VLGEPGARIDNPRLPWSENFNGIVEPAWDVLIAGRFLTGGQGLRPKHLESRRKPRFRDSGDLWRDAARHRCVGSVGISHCGCERDCPADRSSPRSDQPPRNGG